MARRNAKNKAKRSAAEQATAERHEAAEPRDSAKPEIAAEARVTPDEQEASAPFTRRPEAQPTTAATPERLEGHRATPARVENEGDIAAKSCAVRIKEEKAMQDATKAQEVFNQATGKGLETATMWAEANQRVLRDLAELSAGAAKESIRLYSELQQTAIDAFRETQTTALRWQASLQDAPKDPVQWYQKAVSETVDGAQKWFQYIEGNAQAVTRAAERLQSSAEQTGKGIQQTFTEFVGKMKEVYARS